MDYHGLSLLRSISRALKPKSHVPLQSGLDSEKTAPAAGRSLTREEGFSGLASAHVQSRDSEPKQNP